MYLEIQKKLVHLGKNNFVIDKNQVISFTEELWNKIVKLAKGEKLNDEIKEPPLALQPLSLVGIKPIQITPLENNELPIPEFKLIEIPKADADKEDETETISSLEITKKELEDTYGKVKYKTRLVDGKEQNCAFYKNNETGNTERVLVLENGETEKLVIIDDNGKKEFVTESALLKSTGLNLLPEGVKCECDENGNLTFYDKKTGGSISADKVKDFGKEVEKAIISSNSQVKTIPQGAINHSPARRITMNDEEIEAYLNNGVDMSCQKFLTYLSQIDENMKAIESKYNFNREDLLGVFNINDDVTKDSYSEYSVSYEIGNERLLDIKETLKYWQDTPKEADVSKNFRRYNQLTLTEVRHETLPDGVKVYHAKEGYYSLCFEKLSDEELKIHGLTLID